MLELSSPDPIAYWKPLGWSRDLFEFLENFASNVWSDEINSKRSLHQLKTVNQLITVLDKSKKHGGEPIKYRVSTTERTRDLRKEIEAVKKFLDQPVCAANPRPQGANSLTWLKWTVWNLAPFFVHTSKTDSLHEGEFAWPLLARFVYWTAGPTVLRPKRKCQSSAEAPQADVDPMVLFGDQLRKIYIRLSPNTPRDPHINIHLAAWYKKQNYISIWLNPAHDRAYPKVKKKSPVTKKKSSRSSG